MDTKTKTIEVLRGGYAYRVKGYAAQATTILRGLEDRGHHTIQWEVCTAHSDQVIMREAQPGRDVVRLWTGSD